MYNIGDKVVYPMHGAGIIVGIEEKKILDKVRKYYILKLPINDMEVMVPFDNVDESGVRDIMTKQDMDEVLKILEEDEVLDMPKNWSRRYQFNMDRIKTGDVEEIAKVVRTLEKVDTEKSLSTGERKLLRNAKQIILSEMVLVYDKKLEDVEKLVDEAVLK